MPHSPICDTFLYNKYNISFPSIRIVRHFFLRKQDIPYLCLSFLRSKNTTVERSLRLPTVQLRFVEAWRLADYCNYAVVIKRIPERVMETGFLNFHDEEHFSDFSLPLDEHNLMENPQDLLMHIVENDFEYMETHLDATNSDSLWGNEEEDDANIVDLSVSDVSSVVNKMDIKEDFAKVLTDWQEHIGYLQASDMEEYMDIIGLSMTAPDKKNFCLENSTSYITENEVIQEKNIEAIEHISNVEEKIKHEEVANCNTNDKSNKNPKTELNIKKKKSPNGNNTTSSKITKKIRNNAEKISIKQKKRKKNTKEKISIKVKQETETEDCIDIETVSDEMPVLEAGDVKSLLEQFEASENSAIKTMCRDKVSTESNQSVYIQSSNIHPSTKQTLSVLPEKSTAQSSNLHKNIRDSLPKEVIDRIKASGRKRVISVIPAIPSTQGGIRSNGTRMQDAAATLTRNKLLKIVTNNANTRTIDGGLVQLDHDYCSNSNSTINNLSSNSEYERQSSDSEKTVSKDNKSQQFDYHATVTNRTIVTQPKNFAKSEECRVNRNSKKDSGLEIEEEISDNSEEQLSCKSKRTNGVKKQTSKQIKECPKDTQLQEQNSKHSSSNLLSENIPKAQNAPLNKPTPVYEMKIRSALATSILQLRKDALNNIRSIQPNKQMVSVLKKPPNTVQPILTTNPNESIVTTTNSSNDEVQNIIIQNTQESSKEETKKPPRRKLNLAEYRSRREQNRSDSSRTNSPIQPMALLYVHHASTTTEPIKDNSGNLSWCEREIISVLKPKADLDEEKVKQKPPTSEMGIQTYETVFEFPTKSLVDIDERNEEQRNKRIRDNKDRPYRKRRLTSSSSRSRSRSKSKSRSYTRSRSRSKSRSRSTNKNKNRSRSRSRNRSRSRSCRRSNTRRRRISHRRSSVSSSTSWTSHSRSDTRSTSRSRSRYSCSRSRSSRSRTRSRSRSSSQFSNCSRSPPNSYRRPYDNWYDREKQRQLQERRIVYVGCLDEGITKADLRRRFEAFGPIVDTSVHFREHGDNYGFVIFAYKNDAYEAIEHGNDDPTLPRYELCFGGRRAFCKVKYADLDGLASNSLNGSSLSQNNEDNTFDLLLKEAKAKLRKRKV
ncbi:serine/arginine repetitive matrix protein 2-like isoform X2 [Vespula pensylvanica]|uniref:serine/arginine repetitive matrix protein 2-like isoform X2 n=1 Tax=Vespula pensylvanica TaxID=30213 RepID=UPI001CB9F7FD|nr:serine/arginine repetitive matrix protein 2-like isoform X2 [Vespula pensylvanica]